MNYVAIFDMDGVLTDNNAWHIRAWIIFAKKYGMSITPKEVENHFGNTNRDYLAFLFGREFKPEEADRLAEEKEQLYRSLCEPHIKPLNGLTGFLNDLKSNNFKIGLATGGPVTNVRFVTEKLKIARFFDAYVYDSMVKQGKPSPEIFLKTAELLDIDPQYCIVFEDSVLGIEAALRAGMLPVGVCTSGNKDKLKNARLVINDFSEINAKKTLELINGFNV